MKIYKIYKVTSSRYTNNVQHTQYIVAENIDAMLDMFGRESTRNIDIIEVLASNVMVQDK